jgi:flagellin
MAVINTNVKALFSQAALKLTERNQQVSMQQLSTGKRINSSRDDAAGMAITTRMTHQIRSLNQAVRNASDAVTLIQTAEGATNEITEMMQRMRELAIQASNDTNNNDQRSYLDLEFQQLKKQIVQISDNTEWNGFPVLNGSTGERVGIKPVYKTTSEPMSADDVRVRTHLASTSSQTVTGTLTEHAVVNFTPLLQGRSITVAGLTYTASSNNTATEVAAAFSNLAQGTTASQLSANKGTFAGSLSGFSSQLASGANVKFVSATPDSNVTDLSVVVTGPPPPVVTIQGSGSTTESSGITFDPLVAGQSVTVAGLTYSATVDNTAADVARAFANIAPNTLAASIPASQTVKGNFTGSLVGFGSDPTTAIPNIQTNQTSTYIEFFDSTRPGEAITLASDASANISSGVISIVGGNMYLGDGTSANVIGQVDATYNGSSGVMRFNYVRTFQNTNFDVGTAGSSVIAGWSVTNSRIRLDGSSILGGFGTVVDTTTANGGLEATSLGSGSYATTLSTESSSGTGLSVHLNSNLSGVVNTPAGKGGVVHGPAIVSNSSVTLGPGDRVSFDWKAVGGSDAYDVMAYLINVNDGNKEVMLNQTGTAPGTAGFQTNWANISYSIQNSGTYRFAFVSGTWDATGGQAAGASLYVDNIQISVVNPMNFSAPQIQSIKSKLTFSQNDLALGKVRFTSPTNYNNVGDLTVTSTFVAPSVTTVDGKGPDPKGVTENPTLTFPAMSKGQTITVAGLTYTATVANSGAEVAAAFVNISSGATTGASTKGTYSGTLTAFSSGPKTASSDVTFTSTTRFTNVTDITVSSGTTVAGGAIALSPTVSMPSAQQGAAGGGIVLGGAGAFAKSGFLSVVAGSASTLNSATFTLDDGQIFDLNVNNAVTIAAGVVSIDQTALERAGIYILSGGNVALSQFTRTGSPAAFASGDMVGLTVSRDLPDLEPMYAGDVIINGIPIGASRIADDTISQQSGNQIASAIAKAAAINEKTPSTGVQATVNPTLMTGAAMSGTGQARGTLNINGFTTPMINTVPDNPRDSRITAVNAINFISAQTGVRAIDSLIDSKGIILVADDGRNIEVAFNTVSTDTDFSRLTGLKQGVQTGTFSLESMVETPVNITTATNGNVHRAGLETINYDSKTLTTVTTKERPEVTSVSDIKSLNINDLMINGVAIRAALPSDDTLSVTQSVTSKAEASAIATAAAINANTAKTGVTAVPVPVKINGNVTSTGLPTAVTLSATAGSSVSLYINGKNIQVVMSTTQTEDDRRAAVVAAIHASAGLTAVDAYDNGNGGVTLAALDGRNVSIWFDSNKVNAGSFGLGEGTVTHTPAGVTAVNGGSINTTSAATLYASVALQSEKAIKVEPGNNGFNADANFVNLGFSQGTFGGEVDAAVSKMSPPRTGRLAFQVGANEGQRITIDLADFGKGGPITGEITWDADLDPMPPGSDIPVAEQGGPNLMGKPLTRSFISSSVAAQDVLKKLDVAMDKVNQTRATMGAVMNRLDHVINNLINVSMNLSGSRSQIQDADYAAASTQLVKTQIMQQASTAILAQANNSQQSVLKLLEG